MAALDEMIGTMWVRRRVVFLVTLLLATPTSANTVYKAVGPDGEITYSDKAPADRARTNTLEFRNLPSSPLPAEVLRFREQLEKSAQNRISAARAPRAGEVALFTAAWCGHCKRAKAHLAAAQINYMEYDIENVDGMRAFIGAGGSGGVPLLVAGERRVQGYSARPTIDWPQHFGRAKKSGWPAAADPTVAE